MTDDAVVTPEAIDGGFVPRPRDGIHCLDLGDEAVLYDEPSARLHTLNATAALVWSCFDGSVTLDELSDELAAACQVESEVIRAEVVNLTRDFANEGMLLGVVPSDLDRPANDSAELVDHTPRILDEDDCQSGEPELTGGENPDPGEREAHDVKTPRFLADPPSS